MRNDETRDWVSDDTNWSHKAWMSCRDADLFEAVLLQVAQDKGECCEVLEWGSGRSTRYFTDMLMATGVSFRWLSLEYDHEFFASLGIEPRTDPIRTSVHFVGRSGEDGNFTAPPTTRSSLEYVVFKYGKLQPMLAAHGDDRKVRMDDYVRFPGQLGRRYDIVLVDGRHRRECLIYARQWLSDSGVVVLHDAYRPYYHCAFDVYSWATFAGDMLWFGANAAVRVLATELPSCGEA